MRSTDRLTTVQTTSKHAVRTDIPKEIVMEIQGDRIVFRHKGEKMRWSLPIATAFRNAIERTP